MSRMNKIPYSEGTPTNLMIGPFRLNRCYYMDCVKALKLIPKNSFDLCLTDPPWNVSLEKKARTTILHGRKLVTRDEIIDYKDTINNEWYNEWLPKVLSISTGSIIFVGQDNLKWWYAQENEPSCILVANACNSPSRNMKISIYNNIDLALCWGKFKRKLPTNVITYVKEWGFLRKTDYIHSSPKSGELFKFILEHIHPRMVLDPFHGSGATAEAAEYHGIPWLAFEINEEYRVDVEKRIKNGIQERKEMEENETVAQKATSYF